MIGGIFYEHGHRMIASFVGLLTIVLACWLASVEHRKWVKKLGWLALAMVVLQGVLGGITVLFLLPTVVSVGHACLAQLFFCIVCILALVTSPGWQNRNKDKSYTLSSERVSSLRRLTIATNSAIFLQLILGATLRHKAFGVVPHLLGAVIVTLLVVWVVIQVASQHSDEREILNWTLMLNGLLAAQLLLGAATYWIRHVTEFSPQPLPSMVALTVTHLVVGALVLASSVVLTFQVGRAVDIRTRKLPQVS
jgi:cytochrome c oxidase assembly protein subunit 15